MDDERVVIRSAEREYRIVAVVEADHDMGRGDPFDGTGVVEECDSCSWER